MKVAKGMLAIFAIKLLLIGGAFVIQSCETEEIERKHKNEQKLAFSKFEMLVSESIPEIRIIKEKQEKNLILKAQL